MGKQQVSSKQVPNIGQKKSIFEQAKFSQFNQNVTAPIATTDLSDYHQPQPGEMIANVSHTLSSLKSTSPPNYLTGKQLHAPKRQESEANNIPVNQLKIASVDLPTQRKGEVSLQTQHPNQTGLPNRLKAGIENLSGYSLDNVKVHYNSHKPAQLQAHAYTQGTEIHLASGQEKHLPHEAWHVVQQMQGRVQPTMQSKGVAINDDAKLEQEADVMGKQAMGTYKQEQGYLNLPNLHKPDSSITQCHNQTIQRAIGLEIEIPVPIDQLTGTQMTQIRNEVRAEQTAATDPLKTQHKLNAKNIRDANGRVPYGIIRPSAGGFRVDADHDDRVKTLPWNTPPGWPLPEGGVDSIMEIVMDPPATDIDAFNDTMDNISTFIDTLMTNTNNLTRRWNNAFGGVSAGPLHYTGLGFPAVRQPHHNLQGSVQVNIGIDLREYHSLLKWYANSNYAKANRVPVGERGLYRQIKTDITQAVNIGRTITQNINNTLTPLQRRQMGNLRGLRGWITHLALYLKRGTIGLGVLGGSAKNIAPVLLKSPNIIAAQYGMTTAEQTYFTNHRNNIMVQILRRTGRVGDATAVANANLLLNPNPLSNIDAFAASPGSTDADVLSNLTSGVGQVPLAGTPLANPTGVGSTRQGNHAVQNIPNVPVGNIGGGLDTRGGIVVEFRTLPGYYDGVDSWRSLGLEFLQAAITRNSRSGI